MHRSDLLQYFDRSEVSKVHQINERLIDDKPKRCYMDLKARLDKSGRPDGKDIIIILRQHYLKHERKMLILHPQQHFIQNLVTQCTKCSNSKTIFYYPSPPFTTFFQKLLYFACYVTISYTLFTKGLRRISYSTCTFTLALHTHTQRS